VINSTTGLVSSDTKILRTSNAGINWTVQAGGSGGRGFDLFFTDSLTGYCPGGSNEMFKTTNGGINWFRLTTGSTSNLYTITFINSSTGYATGERGVILYTTNSGSNWKIQQNVSNNYLYSINFTNSSTGFISGDFGTILKTTNGGLSFIQNNNSFLNKGFELYQNYPNPFNPVTKINYELPASRQGGRITNYVSLKVYDILGNEVANLVNEKKNPGSYEVEFNGSKLSSGIYFVSLSVNGNVIDTKSMVLVK